MSSEGSSTHTTFAPTSENKSDSFPSLQIVWHMVGAFAFLHICAVTGLYLVFTSAMWKTTLFALFLHFFSCVGITAGVHRLWGHKSYKAKLPLRILLAFMSTIAHQLGIYWWARDHRLHHKYTETNADAYNSKRGFFFSHMGWLMVKKHPDVIEKGKTIDISDILSDPVVAFQKKYYPVLVIICCFILPIVIPMMAWEENFINSTMIAVFLRLSLSYHTTYLINSAAHMWGNQPYDQKDESRQNILVTIAGIGEGFHNYHHTFPWDYSASEFGSFFNLSTAFIDLMAWLGLAYDLKTVPPEVIRKRAKRNGDGSYEWSQSSTANNGRRCEI